MYSVAHPALSPDEKTLYFASNMPGTKGESDIFKVAINEDGTFGKPTNLTGKISKFSNRNSTTEIINLKDLLSYLEHQQI